MALIAAAGGWLVAYFINYLADVLVISRRLSPPVCPACQAPSALLSYLLLRPCAACGQRRTRRTWWVQAGMAVVFAWMWLNPPGRLGFWIGAGLFAYFVLVVIIDLEHRLILHPISWIGAVIGLLVGTYQKGIVFTLLGGAAGYGIMFILYYLGVLFNRLVSRMRGQETEDALGFGDVNLAGIVGLLLGWPEIVGGLLIAILSGGLVSGLILIRMKLSRSYQAMTAIPYAPFLILGAILFLYIPNQ